MSRTARRSLLLTALLTAPLPAQVVRGRVTEVNSATPVVGALVSLLGETGDSTLVSVLTTRTGDYAVRAPGVGTYRLAVKRIGVQRFVSVPFSLGSGETRNVDVPIAALAMTLPEVSVSGLCVTQPRDLRRIASLWDEARTALEATEISLRDRLIEAEISRYAAEVQSGSLRVLFDWRSDAQLMVRQPFTSMSGDSLSAAGYWRQVEGDSVEYLAPDASALASNAFLRDHCFSLARGPRRNRPDLVGLSFVPARDRTLPDISGTVWLDAKSLQLRFIDFQYTRLPPEIPNANQVGGEVHFARLESGAWIVDRWFIRMPQLVIMQDEVFPRRQLREEGGTVITNGVEPSTVVASLTGVVRDSMGRALAGAVVRAIGTHRQTLSGADGSYRLDSLPPGGLSVVVHTDGYDSFAMLAASRRVDLVPGRTQRLDLRAVNASTLRGDACQNPDAPYIQRMANVGALRVLMVDSATSVPISGVQFVVSWPARSVEVTGANYPRGFRQAITDSRGAATFCSVPLMARPARFPLDVSVVGPGTTITFVMEVTLNPTGLVGRVVTGRINR